MTLLQKLYLLQNFDAKTLKHPSWWLFGTGLMTALAFEPFGWDIWVLAPGFWLLLSLSYPASLKTAFYRGWLFGLGHYLGGLYWISLSLMVDFKKFFWLFPLALGAIPAILGLLSGLSVCLSNVFSKNWARATAFCFLWCLLEWLRGHILGGFPWNLMGYVWVSELKILQITHIIGIYGLGLLTMLMAVFAFHRKGVWITGLVWAGLWIYGHQRLTHPSTYVPGVLLRLVQPCVQQELKWKPQERQAILNKLYALTQQVSLIAPTHVIWPESAAVVDILHDPQALTQMANHTPLKTQLIFGAPHIQRNRQGTIEHIWNSIFSYTSVQGLKLVYDKVHLVPFGEYVPFRQFLPSFLDKVTPGQLDYSQGPGLITATVDRLPPFSPTICYEIIFPTKVADFSQGTPQWILNLTNDAWFGRSSGPYQHQAMAQTRAVETGLPLVRSANNGISMVVDPYGRVLQSLGLNIPGVIDSPLPQALPSTLYNRYQDTFFFIMMGILGSILCVHFIFSRRKNHDR